MPSTSEQPVLPAAPLPAYTPPPLPTAPKAKRNWMPQLKKMGMIGTILFVVFTVIMLLITVTNLDTKLIKITLQGKVIDYTQKTIANAQVKINGQQVNTNTQGDFSIGGFETGTYEIVITAEGYEELTEAININRTLLNYTSSKTFILSQAGKANISGSFISNKQGYDFSDDRVEIAGTEYKLNLDGSFTIRNITSGPQTLTFRSANYVDYSTRIDLADGENELKAIQLKPAGDVTSSTKSWLTDQPVMEVKFEAEGVNPDQTVIAANGDFRIRDLEIGREYPIRVISAGYETRDYTIKISQGNNQLFEFRLVEEGDVPFLRDVDNSLELFIADFDGKNVRQLTSGRTQPYAETLVGDLLYFLSTRDNINANIGGVAQLTYVVNLTGGNAQRVTTNVENLGRMIPNFQADKLANIYRPQNANKERILEITNLQGEGRLEVFRLTDGEFNDVVLSSNGKYVYFYAQDKNETLNGLYIADTSDGKETKLLNKKNVLIYAVSPDGDKVLYTATNEQTQLTDLFLYTYSTQKDITLRTAYTGNQYQFLNGDNNTLIFFDARDGGTNAYKLDLTTNTETRLTTFTGSEGLDAVYQQGKYIVYQTNRGLYMLDPVKPVSKKLITTEWERFTGYDF